MTETTIQLQVGGQSVSGVLEGPADTSTPIVVHLHGFGSHAFGTKGTFFSRKFIERGVPFCRFDLRGHGESGGDLRDATVGRNLDDLTVVMGELRRRGWQEFILAGSSYGALTQLVYASQHPQGIRACIGIAPAIGLAASIRRREGAERLALWKALGSAPLAGESGSLARSFFEDAELWQSRQLAQDLACPCLLFHGMQDAEIDWPGVQQFAALASDVELHGFVDGDHLLQERLDHTWSEIDLFLCRTLDRFLINDE